MMYLDLTILEKDLVHYWQLHLQSDAARIDTISSIASKHLLRMNDVLLKPIRDAPTTETYGCQYNNQH